MHAYIDNNCLTFRLVTTMNFSFNKNSVLKGTVILTLAGIISRIAGFFYRIFLTRQIGADGIGMFQLVTPVLGIAFALCSAGIQTAISRFCAAKKKISKHMAFCRFSRCTSAICSFYIFHLCLRRFYCCTDFSKQRLLPFYPDSCNCRSILYFSQLRKRLLSRKKAGWTPCIFPAV